MKTIKLSIILFIFFTFISETTIATGLIKPLFNRYRIILVPTNNDFIKPEFVKTVIILKQRLRDSEARFKLTTTYSFEIRITFKNKPEFIKVKDLIFSNSKIGFYVIDYQEKQSEILTNILTENKIEFNFYKPGIFSFKNKIELKDKITNILKNSNKNIEFLWGFTNDEQEEIYLYLIKQKSELTNRHIEKAWVDISKFTNSPEVYMSFNKEGAELFKNLTGDNTNHNIAITINNIVYTAPKIQAKISEGRCLISGDFTKNETRKLSILLNYGSLPLNLEIKEESE